MTESTEAIIARLHNEVTHLRAQRDELQRDNTRLVEENRRLRASADDVVELGNIRPPK